MKRKLQFSVRSLASCSASSVLIILLTACSTEQEPVSSKPVFDAPIVLAEADGAEVTAEEPEETLKTLDGLLPENFGVFTESWRGDLDGMVERRIIRVLVVNGGPHFFFHQGKPRGIMTELLVRLQKQLNQNLDRGLDQVEIFPMPVSRDKLIPALVGGEADLVAADLTITAARSTLVDFSVPLAKNVDEIVVFAPGAGDNVETLDDLSGHSLYVRESSSYFEHLRAFNDDLGSRGIKPVNIVEANELLRVEDILDMVNSGLVEATVIDEYKALHWSAVFRDMQIRNDLTVNRGGEIAWAFRKDSPQLSVAVNDFMKDHRAGTLIGNVLINRYVGNLDWIRNATSDAELERLRPLLELFKAAAKEVGLDPLMLVAQAYQESGLDHSTRSSAGAVGIMQVKPSTAADKNVGIADITTPEANIRAGSRYMRFLIDRYFSDPEMDEIQGWLFALAAYNAGPARVRQLRDQAAAEGYDPYIWVENVEIIAARKIGRETVRYVRNVLKYYVAYRMAWENAERSQALPMNM